MQLAGVVGGMIFTWIYPWEIHEPRLISYKQCSYAQRVAVVLNQKAIKYEIEYIDLANLPGWVKETSPFGKVSILQIDGAVLWESTVRRAQY